MAAARIPEKVVRAYRDDIMAALDVFNFQLRIAQEVGLRVHIGISLLGTNRAVFVESVEQPPAWMDED